MSKKTPRVPLTESEKRILRDMARLGLAAIAARLNQCGLRALAKRASALAKKIPR
jgi:hypothetical protein